MSLNFCFHYIDIMGSFITSLAHKIYIKWWDRFNSFISLYGLPNIAKKKEKFLFSNGVSLSSRCKTHEVVSTFVYAFVSVSTTTNKCVSSVPLTLPPNVYLQYLQVKHKNPMMAEDDVFRLAYTLDIYGLWFSSRSFDTQN